MVTKMGNGKEEREAEVMLAKCVKQRSGTVGPTMCYFLVLFFGLNLLFPNLSGNWRVFGLWRKGQTVGKCGERRSKEDTFGMECRGSLQSGINKLAGAVSVTMGPREDISRQGLETVVMNKMQGLMNVAVVQCPGFRDGKNGVVVCCQVPSRSTLTQTV